MPSNVARFEKLMYLSLGISLVSFILRWYGNDLVLPAGTAFAANGLNLLFKVLFIWLSARRRRNYARWVLLLVFVLSTEKYVRDLLPYWRSHGLDSLSLGLTVQILLELVAFIFIFTGNARDWFKQPKLGVNSTEQSASP
jgi:hypothetical protein